MCRDAKQLLKQCLNDCREVWTRSTDASYQQYDLANPGGRQNRDGRNDLGNLHDAGVPQGQPLSAHCEMPHWGAGGAVCGTLQTLLQICRSCPAVAQPPICFNLPLS